MIVRRDVLLAEPPGLRIWAVLRTPLPVERLDGFLFLESGHGDIPLGPARVRPTVVTWTLSPADGDTLVPMVHSGFRPEDEGFYQGAGYGWQRFVGGLEWGRQDWTG